MAMQCKCFKICEGYIEFNSTKSEKHRKKTSLAKKSVENADWAK